MTLMNRVERFTVNNAVRALVQRVVEARLLIDQGGKLEGGQALEIGCGRGDGTRIILDRFGAERVIAIDLDAAQVQRARAHVGDELGPRAEFRVGDAARLEFPDGSFDAVFEFGVLHHVPAWRQALHEIARVLKPGGRFYFDDLLKELVVSRPFRALFDHPLETQFTGHEFCKALAAAGFDLVGEPALIPRAFIAGVAVRRETRH